MAKSEESQLDQGWQRANLKFADDDYAIPTTLVRLRGGWVDVLVEDDEGEDDLVVRSYPASRVQFVNWVGVDALTARSPSVDARSKQVERIGAFLHRCLREWGDYTWTVAHDRNTARWESISVDSPEAMASLLDQVQGATVLTFFECLTDEFGDPLFDVSLTVEPA